MTRFTRRETVQLLAAGTGLAAYLPNVSIVSGQNSPNENWRMFQYDSRNSGHTSAIGPKENIGAEWVIDVGGVADPPAIVDDSVFIGNGSGQISAISVEDGTQLWQNTPGSEFDVNFPSIHSGPAVSGDTLIIVGRGQEPDNILYALNRNNGEEQWRFRPHYPAIRAPTIAGDNVYIGMSDKSRGQINSISLENGEQQWAYKTGSGVSSAPTVMGNSVFVGTFGPSLYALSADEGTELWTLDLESGGSPAADQMQVSASDETIYVTRQTKLIAFDATTGNKRWQFETGRNGHLIGPAAVTNNTIIVGSVDSYVYAIRPSDGRKIWEFETNAFIGDPPVVADSTVYIGTADNSIAYAISLDGEKRWEYETDGVIKNPIPVVNGGAYISAGTKLVKLSEQSNTDTSSSSSSTVEQASPISPTPSPNPDTPSPTAGSGETSPTRSERPRGELRDFFIRAISTMFSAQALLIQGAAILAALIWLTWPEDDDT